MCPIGLELKWNEDLFSSFELASTNQRALVLFSKGTFTHRLTRHQLHPREKKEQKWSWSRHDGVRTRPQQSGVDQLNSHSVLRHGLKMKENVWNCGWRNILCGHSESAE